MLSTAGEPETPFENTRERIRRQGDRAEAQAGLPADRRGRPLVLHEFMVESDDACADMEKVKRGESALH